MALVLSLPFLSAMRFSKLICHGKILIRIIVSGSSSSKLISSILRITISLQENAKLQESLLKYSILSSAYKKVNHFTCNKPIGNKFRVFEFLVLI